MESTHAVVVNLDVDAYYIACTWYGQHAPEGLNVVLNCTEQHELLNMAHGRVELVPPALRLDFQHGSGVDLQLPDKTGEGQ